MIIQFTGELEFRSPITATEKAKYDGVIDEIRRAMVKGHLSSMYFFEDSIDKRRLQNELLLNQSFLDKDKFGKYTQVVSLPINQSSFIHNQDGHIIALNIENIQPVKDSCIYLRFSIVTLREEVLRSLKTSEDSYQPLKISKIFWEAWDRFKVQIQK